MADVQGIVGSAQRGLMFNPVHGLFVTVCLKDQAAATSKEATLALIRDLNRKAENLDDKTRCVVGFSAEVWQEWSGDKPPGSPPGSIALDRSPVFANTGGHLWFYLKSDAVAGCESLLQILRDGLSQLAETIHQTAAEQRPSGKILDGHFFDGITSPADPVGLASTILHGTGTEAGSCWAISQRFEVDWDRFAGLSPDARVSIIGRDDEGVIIPDDDPRAHIKRARVFDDQRNNLKMLRQSLPFGSSASGHGREEGIYFAGFAQGAGVFDSIITSMLGTGAVPDDRLLSVVQGVAGGYWYIPSAAQLAIPERLDAAEFDLAPHWATRSENGFMYYNSNDYLNAMTTGQYAPGDPPSDRILKLLSNIVSRWRDNWYQYRDIPRMPHLREVLDSDEAAVLEAPIPVRKGMAIKKSLTQLHTNTDYPQTPEHWCWQADQFRIDPSDILFGIMPELALGRGKELMPYLRDDEEIPAFLLGLDENAAMGHIVARHETVLEKGLGAVLADLNTRRDAAIKDDQQNFFTSTILAIEGVQGYMENWAALAERSAQEPGLTASQRENLIAIAARARKLKTERPETLVEATQLIFTMHCCLHLIGNPVAVGRLDQLLAPFYKSSEPCADAQDVIDAFWVKLDEKAIHNRHYITDHLTPGTTAVAYRGGGYFAQGGGINQWVQQVTVGGYLADDAATPTPGNNAITLMCLRAARRLPLNAPCLSLRVHEDMPEELLEEAGKSILSGGAHPILFQEEHMVKGLHEFSGFPLEAARNYACDGCYEPMIAGETEFAFGTVVVLDALELALNEGASYSIAGPVYLRGYKKSFRSQPATEIASFEDLQAIFLKHLHYITVQFFDGVLSSYGNVNKICPSPLLSVLIDGCVESGRDLSNGGAKYHLVAPMFVGLSVAIDSLYAIKKLVFDDASAVTTLPELLECLKSDWGHELQEPWQSTLAGPERAAQKSKRFKALREHALALPKFGTGHAEVDGIATWMVDHMCDMTVSAVEQPPPGLREVIEGIVKNYSTPERPFRFHVCPGVGTFEGYVGEGLESGASANGRRKGQPIASDFSPSPIPQDLDAIPQNEGDPTAVPSANRPLEASLQSWASEPILHKVSNAGPVDLNIREDFPLADLVSFLKQFAAGKTGANLLTITCADPSTYEQAARAPEKLELVRVRQGGWSEFFAAMFPEHQKQHARRPYFTPHRKDNQS